MVNILICGTPGTGKTTLVEKLKSQVPKTFGFHNISKFALENDCVTGFDEELATHVLDEKKLIRKLDTLLAEKLHNIIESIHGDFLTPRIMTRVFVCRTDNTLLFDRLKARGYNESKITNNVQAEIFQIILDEVVDYYGSEMVQELTNNEEADLDTNVAKIKQHISHLLQDS